MIMEMMFYLFITLSRPNLLQTWLMQSEEQKVESKLYNEVRLHVSLDFKTLNMAYLSGKKVN